MNQWDCLQTEQSEFVEGLDLKQNKINSSREGELYYRVSSHFAVMYACVCEEIGIISFSIGRINTLSKYQKI